MTFAGRIVAAVRTRRRLCRQIRGAAVWSQGDRRRFGQTERLWGGVRRVNQTRGVAGTSGRPRASAARGIDIPGTILVGFAAWRFATSQSGRVLTSGAGRIPATATRRQRGPEDALKTQVHPELASSGVARVCAAPGMRRVSAPEVVKTRRLHPFPKCCASSSLSLSLGLLQLLSHGEPN